EKMNPTTALTETVQGAGDQHHASASPHPALDEIARYVGLHDVLDGLVESIESLHRCHREALAGKIDLLEFRIEVSKPRHEALLSHQHLVVGRPRPLERRRSLMELLIDLGHRRTQLLAFGP